MDEQGERICLERFPDRHHH
ncbi:hypothetical protein CEXT_13191, partial [Caerostris extrusa]